MFIGEERVPFDTRSIHSQAPFSVRCIPHQKYRMVAQLLWLNEIVELYLEEESLLNSKNDHDIPILAAFATHMRRDLHQNQGFYKKKKKYLPRYTTDEFKSHCKMT